MAQVGTGNAETKNTVVTSIQLKKGIPEKVFEVINRALNSDYEINRSDDSLTEDFEYDVLIIVGTVKR